MQRLNKDPDSSEWFTVPWTARLGTVLISTAVYATSPSGLTKDADSFDASKATTSARFSGGTLGTIYTVTTRITTDDGQTLDFSYLLIVRQG